METLESPAAPLRAVITWTALGIAGVALSPAGIRYATLFHRTPDACAAELARIGAATAASSEGESAAAALVAYAGGDGRALEAFPVDLPSCSAFQRDTWLALREIPCGQTRSYGWLARRLGRPGSARAVGAAVGANPIPLWLPCHRVVASDGSLHGFAGGLGMKRQLLALECTLPARLAWVDGLVAPYSGGQPRS